MKMYILMILSLKTFTSFAQTAPNEEAIILNQEMQYLQEMAQNVQLTSTTSTSETNNKIDTTATDLEEEYFGKPESQSVSTKASGPKRRSF